MGFLISQTSAGSQNYKTAARAASSANVALSGVHPLLLGGVTLANKDRVLLKDQGDATENGLYVYTVSGGSYTLVRSADANTDKEVVPNMIVPISEGTFADTAFQLVTNGPISLGSTALTFGFLVEQYTDQDAIDAVLNNVELADFSDFYTTGIRSNVRYVNDGELDIQAAVNAVGAEQGKAIYLSPGSYGGATVTVTDKVNLRIIGPATTSGSHLCELSGGRAMTISGATSTRVGLMNFEIEGGLTITGTQGRHYLRDMILGGLVISGSTSNFLVFQNCSFTGPVSVNVPLGTLVYFIQCDFGNQTVTNTSVVPQQVIFNNCAGFNSLPTGTLLGQSVLAAGASQVNSDKVLVSAGTESLPSLTFANDSDTGIYQVTDNSVGIVVGGSRYLTVNTSGTTVGGTLYAQGISGGVPYTQISLNNINNTSINGPVQHNDSIVESVSLPMSRANLGFSTLSGNTWSRFSGIHALGKLSAGWASDAQASMSPASLYIRPREYNQAAGGALFDTASSGTTLTVLWNFNANNIAQYAGVGDYLESTGSPGVRAKITGFTAQNVVTVDTALNAGTLTVIPNIAIFSKANGTEAVKIDPNGRLELNGAIALKSLHTQSGTVTVTVSDCYVGCSSGAVVNLPSAALCKPGQKLIIKDESGAATTNNISINANGSDLIDGNASESLVVNYESITLICNGVDEWFII